ncbi:MAG: pyridoxal kinase [Qingshengfaniella sp.]
MNRPPLVITIQSQVAYGHVGNSAAVFPLLASGLEVAQVPTVLFSNTPAHPTLRGRALPADLFADLLTGLQERGLPERAAFIISGYIRSPEIAELTADFIAHAKAANPGLTYLCDPVMGDSGPGLYVSEEITRVMRDRLLPMADLATPNQFELGFLGGGEIRTLADLAKASAQVPLPNGAHLITTGCLLDDTAPGHLESIVSGPDGIDRHSTAHRPAALGGTGDLFAALVIAGLGQGLDLGPAIDRAQTLVTCALERALVLGNREVVMSDPSFRAALLGQTTG